MFEYKMWHISLVSELEKIEIELNYINDIGWEIVSMFHDAPHNRYLIVSRRPKKVAASPDMGFER